MIVRQIGSAKMKNNNALSYFAQQNNSVGGMADAANNYRRGV
jgi:hypothetical protein